MRQRSVGGRSSCRRSPECQGGHCFRTQGFDGLAGSGFETTGSSMKNSPSYGSYRPHESSCDPLSDWLEQITGNEFVAIDLTLDRIRRVASRLQLLSFEGRVITVAGTNGKGSTVRLLEAVLLASGLSVGSTTSPHLRCLNERICINGCPAGDSTLVEAFEVIGQARGDIALTYFEYVILAALWIMKNARVEVLLLEVGLGGRLDAVNMVDADIAVVTNIDIDHTEFLGSTRELIGAEKAGIFRQGQLAVLGDPNPPASVLAQAHRLDVDLKRRGRDFFVEDDCFLLENQHLPLQQALLPKSSLATALAVLYYGFGLNPQDNHRVMLSTRLSGRLQQIKKNIWLDVGHNPAAARYLCEEMSSRSKGRLRCVYATLGNKDVFGFASALSPVIDGWYLGATLGERGRSARKLAADLARLPQLNIRSVDEDLPSLLATATADQSEDSLLICGSFQCVDKATQWFGDGAV